VRIVLADEVLARLSRSELGADAVLERKGVTIQP
jgi:hypothetical protein